MKMSEAYDRTKKLERMISDLQHSIKSLEHRAIPDNNTYCHSIAITTLEAKRQELIEAVTELGNMEVQFSPTAFVNPLLKEDNAAQNIAAKEQQHGFPAPSEKYGWTGLQLLNELCMFSNNNGRSWHGPFKCIGYFEDKIPPYQAIGNGFWPLAKWYDGI